MGQFTVDNSPPQLAVHNPTAGDELFNKAPLRISVTDPNLSHYALGQRAQGAPRAVTLVSGHKPAQDEVVHILDTYAQANGDYGLSLTATDTVGNTHMLVVPFRIDNIIISNVSNAPVFFAPVKGDTTVISYELDRDADITLEMLQRDSQNGDVLAVKATPYQDAPRRQGENRDPWDGKDDDGALLPSTYYPYRITARQDGRVRVHETPFITGIFEPSLGGAPSW